MLSDNGKTFKAAAKIAISIMTSPNGNWWEGASVLNQAMLAKTLGKAKFLYDKIFIALTVIEMVEAFQLYVVE